MEGGRECSRHSEELAQGTKEENISVFFLETEQNSVLTHAISKFSEFYQVSFTVTFSFFSIKWEQECVPHSNGKLIKTYMVSS